MFVIEKIHDFLIGVVAYLFGIRCCELSGVTVDRLNEESSGLVGERIEFFEVLVHLGNRLYHVLYNSN